MAGWQHATALAVGDHRQPEFLGRLPGGGVGVVQPDIRAEHEYRPLGGGEQPGDGADRAGIGRIPPVVVTGVRVGPAGARPGRLRPGGTCPGRRSSGRPGRARRARPAARARRAGLASSAEGRLQRDVEKDRPAMPGRGQAEGLVDRCADPARLVLGPGPLGDGRQQLRMVNLLQAPGAPPCVGRAAAKDHDRRSVKVRGGHGAHAVRHARASGEYGEPGRALEPGRGLGREDRRLLVPDVDDAHRRIRLDRAVIEREDVQAGQREHGPCAVPERGGHGVRAAVRRSLVRAIRSGPGISLRRALARPIRRGLVRACRRLRRPVRG